MRICMLVIFAALLAVPGFAYTPPDYPQRPMLVESVSVRMPSRAALGSNIRAQFDIRSKEPLPADARVFLYLSLDDRTYVSHVTHPSRSVSVAVPKDIPSGEYSVEAGVFGEKAAWSGTIRITGAPSPVLRKIITRGTFTDKYGVPHRWHINDAHALVWDGVPWIPAGGMFIYDRDWNLVQAQLELLEKYGVKDIYLHLGVNQPYLWKDYSDDDYAYFQKTIDYLDEHGFRYGVEFQALESKGYGYPYVAGGPRVEVTESGKVRAEDKDVRGGYFMVENQATGEMVQHGSVTVSDNKTMEADVKVPGTGKYKVIFLPDKIDDGFVMYYWGGVYEKYRDKVLAHYSKVKLGPGFRFVVDPLWNEMNTRHGLIPSTDDYRQAFGKWLRQRYGTIEKLNAAWKPRDGAFPDFASAASAVSMERTDDRKTKKLIQWVYAPKVDKLYALDATTSQFNYDIREYHGRAILEFCNRIADDFGRIADVPVIYKCFSDVDWWHINDTGSAGGHDGLGMESYGTGEPMLLFMGVHAYGELKQATKTTWLVVTETGEGNHQDASPSRNKGIGYTSRMGTMYANYNALLSGGAKGVFQYYMIGGRGVDQPWTDAVSRDPRQLEWLATYGRILANADKLVDYKPPIYLRLPAHFNQHSMEIYSEPNSDFSNYGGWWWREPIGRSQNNIWIVPEVSMKADVAMHIVNLEKQPASERFADELTQAIEDGKRVTMIGFRYDLGTIPIVDRYYTDRFSTDKDGRKFQVLLPSPSGRGPGGEGVKVLGQNEKGEVWNLIVGNLQINSKEVFPRHGYQPQDLAVGREKALDPYYGMFDLLGVKLFDGGFAYRDGGDYVTVVETAEAVPLDKGDRPRGRGGSGTSSQPSLSRRGVADAFAIPVKPGEKVDARYPDGTPAGEVRDGKLHVYLEPVYMKLVRANLPWAPEGIMVDSLAARDAVIIKSADRIQPSKLTSRSTSTGPYSDSSITVEGENPVAHNWNYSRMGAMPNLSGAACLALETAVPPPADTGWYAKYRFRADKPGEYAMWIRENLLGYSSPSSWRIDVGEWHDSPNTLVPRDVEVVTLYNALEDTRQIFAWYHYANVKLPAGDHTLTIKVNEPRGKNMLVTMADDRPYAKMIDCILFGPSHPSHPSYPSHNLLADNSLEFDEDKDDKPDYWTKSEDSDKLAWTKPGWGNYKIEGLVDINCGMRDSYTGQRALRIDPGPSERSWNSVRLPVRPGVEYELAGFVRSTSTDALGMLSVTWYDSAGRKIGRTDTTTVGNSDWKRVEVTDARKASHAVISCVVTPGTNGSVWFDEIVFAGRAKP
ncbi:MAG: hypothetical protein KBC96_08195 [Armatimonadetes bacterium]|nr:hypothetical protein [Armatimonadota bacterium]